MTCDTISFFSVLHVAVQGGYEQVVNNIVQLVQLLPPTQEPFLDRRNYLEKVRRFINIAVKKGTYNVKKYYIYIHIYIYIYIYISIILIAVFCLCVSVCL